jgi:drug/metabolite transporter (DMT)-like permease
VHKADIAALLALGAALFIAVGDVIHQRQAQEVTGEPVGHYRLFVRLLKDPRWWFGSAVAGVGFALQAAALGLGSVLLVQALLVTSLLFALPIHAWTRRRRLSGWEWAWAVLLAAAVAVIVTVGDPSEGHAHAGDKTWLLVIAILGPLLVACVVGANLIEGPGSAVLLGLVSGALWGVFAVLTKGVVDQLGQGLWPLVRSPELYAWVAVAIAGTSWQQSSFRAGAMTASLPAMAVAEPVVASVLGVVILGEKLRPGDAGWAVLIAAIITMVVAAAALARGQAAAEPSEVAETTG